jgi:hypothetical protein
MSCDSGAYTTVRQWTRRPYCGMLTPYDRDVVLNAITRCLTRRRVKSLCLGSSSSAAF